MNNKNYYVNRRSMLGLLGGLASSGIYAAPTTQVQGVSDNSIKIGRSHPSSHPAFKEMSKQRRIGADACVAQVNMTGGVHGRKIHMFDQDDAYSPEQAALAIEHLLHKDQVFALLGAFGTTTLPVIMKAAEAEKIPMVGAVTLSHEERDPPKRYVFPVRAGALSETAHIIDHQLTIAVKRFVILASNEAYGPEGAAAFQIALKSAKQAPAPEIRFSIKDDPLKIAEQLRNTDAQTVLLSVLPGPLANILRHYKKLGSGVRMQHMVGFSAMRIEDLAQALGPLAAGIQLSQTVPFPYRPTTRVTRRFHAALAAHAPDEKPSYHGLDAYIEAAVLIEGLRRAGRQLSREALVLALESMNNFDVGGELIEYGPDNRTGSRFVDLVMLTGTERLVY